LKSFKTFKEDETFENLGLHYDVMARKHLGRDKEVLST